MLPSLVESVISSLISWHLVYVSSSVFILYVEARRCLCLHVYFSASGFLNFSTTAILGWTVLCSGGCPAHCSMCSGIPGLYPLDVISTLSPLRLTKMSPDIARCPLGLGWGETSPGWELRLYTRLGAPQRPLVFLLVCPVPSTKWSMNLCDWPRMWGLISVEWTHSSPHLISRISAALLLRTSRIKMSGRYRRTLTSSYILTIDPNYWLTLCDMCDRLTYVPLSSICF